MGKPPKSPLQSDPLDTPLPSPHLRIASRPLREQGNLLFVLSPTTAEGAAIKSRLNFFILPLINFYWSRRPRTLVGNIRTPVTLGWAHPNDLILALLDLQKPYFQIRSFLRFCEFELQHNFLWGIQFSV